MSAGRARWQVLAVITALAAVAGRAAAETHPTVQLRYARPDALTACPTNAELRDAVTSRLGYDPFAADAPRTIAVTIADGDAGLGADIALRDGDHELGTRHLAAAEHDCRELAAAIALAVTVSIDPLSAFPQPAPEPLAPQPLPVAAQPSPVTPHSPTCLRAALTALASLGSEPGPTAGFTAAIGARRGNASLALEGRVDLAASTSDATGTVRSSLLLAELVPCAHHRYLVGCAVLAAGAMQGTGVDVALPRERTTFYSAIGIRLGTEIPLTGAFALAIHLDVLATVTRTRLMLETTTVWTTPPLSGLLAVGVVGDFL